MLLLKRPQPAGTSIATTSPGWIHGSPISLLPKVGARHCDTVLLDS